MGSNARIQSTCAAESTRRHRPNSGTTKQKPERIPQHKLFQDLNTLSAGTGGKDGKPLPPQTASRQNGEVEPPLITNDTSKESAAKPGQFLTMLAMGGFSVQARNDAVDEELENEYARKQPEEYGTSDFNNVEETKLDDEDMKMAFG